MRVEYWWDLAFRGAFPLETHTSSAGLLPALPVERNMCKINMFPQPYSEVTTQDRIVERPRLKYTQYKERERENKSWLSSCCQGQHQPEAVLGLESNVG